MTESTDETPEIDDEIIACWCGAKGTCDELFDDSVFEENCGGLGVLYCYCGGDLCVCHNHGEIECPGCDDCQSEDFDDDSDYCGEDD